MFEWVLVLVGGMILGANLYFLVASILKKLTKPKSNGRFTDADRDAGRETQRLNREIANMRREKEKLKVKAELDDLKEELYGTEDEDEREEEEPTSPLESLAVGFLETAMKNKAPAEAPAEAQAQAPAVKKMISYVEMAKKVPKKQLAGYIKKNSDKIAEELKS